MDVGGSARARTHATVHDDDMIEHAPNKVPGGGGNCK
jgi:hypothetical protein